MSFNKAAYLRYTIIDACIASKQRPFPSMDELIDACERKLDKKFTISTIQKDIKDLKEGIMGQEAPIKFSKSRNGYYYADPNFSLREISLQDSEIEALRASVDLLTMYMGSRVSENFSSAVEKIFASIQERFPEKDGSRRIIQTDSSVNHKGFEHFEFFLHAARERMPVSFVHYSYKHRQFKGIILHPIILKEFQNNWYVVGHSENHNELRTFGLDRIYDPILLKRTFIEPKEKVREDYFKHVYGVYPLENEKLQEIEFVVSPVLSDYIHAHPIHESQERFKQGNYGHGYFRLKLIPTVELINYFLSFSQQLTVKKPEWIQEEIRKKHIDALQYETKPESTVSN